MYLALFQPLSTPERKGYGSIFMTTIFYKLIAISWTNFRHKICVELVSSKQLLFWRCFSCILHYFNPFQPRSGKVPYRFSWHQFSYKLTATYCTNFRLKICLELISSNHRIFERCFSFILRYFSPFQPPSGKVPDRFSWHQFFAS